jgi:hypothetical protein
MKILKVGNLVDLNIKLQVLRAFACDDDLYYIVGIVKEGVSWCNMNKRVLATLNVDGSCQSITQEVLQKANAIIAQENLGNL